MHAVGSCYDEPSMDQVTRFYSKVKKDRVRTFERKGRNDRGLSIAPTDGSSLPSRTQDSETMETGPHKSMKHGSDCTKRVKVTIACRGSA